MMCDCFAKSFAKECADSCHWLGGRGWLQRRWGLLRAGHTRVGGKVRLQTRRSLTTFACTAIAVVVDALRAATVARRHGCGHITATTALAVTGGNGTSIAGTGARGGSTGASGGSHGERSTGGDPDIGNSSASGSGSR